METKNTDIQQHLSEIQTETFSICTGKRVLALLDESSEGEIFNLSYVIECLEKVFYLIVL